MVDILSLIGDLQARTSHSKMHAVHVNLTGIWLTLGSFLQVGSFVGEDGHLDLDLLLAALVDRLGQAEEPRVRAARLLRDEVLMSVFVGLLNAALIRFFDVRSDLLIRRSHRVGSAQNRASRG